jgi:hypothetical protein
MSKISTIPSRLIYSVDVPEVESFKAEFVYNYYIPDESVQDYVHDKNALISTANKMNLLPSVLNKPGYEIEGYLNSVSKISDLKKLPRYVKLIWNSNNRLSLTTTEQSIALNNASKLKEEDIPKISKEDQFASSYYTSIESNNGVLVQAMSSLFDSTYDLKDKNNQIDTDLRNNFSNAQKSNLKIFDESNTDFHASMSAISYQKGGLELENQVSDAYLQKLKSTKFQSQINNNFLFDILKQASESQHPNNKTLKSFIDYSLKVNGIVPNYKLSESEYKASIPYHTVYEFGKGYQGHVGSNQDNESTFKIVGYVIDKVEVFIDGTINRFSPIVINGGKSNSYIDLQVRYGAVYFYSIRSIMDVTYNAIDNKNYNFIRVGSFVASKDTIIDVQTIEHIAPPPPADFKIAWDYDRVNQNTVIFDHENNRPFPNTGKRGSLMLSWSMPVNPQMDIKKFQIFRRKTVNDPFEIIKMYDFDDSFSKFISLETKIKQELISNFDEPILYFFDDDFYKNSEYIYALASVDAHGLTSNYSEQFKIIFNKFTNKIEKTLISIAGAPKPYPNMYLEKDLFVDTFKTSNKNKMYVYLHPDCISTNKEAIFFQKNGENKEHDRQKYVINIINTDVQKSKQISIFLQKKFTNS